MIRHFYILDRESTLFLLAKSATSITRPTTQSQVLHSPSRKPLAKARIDLVSAKSSFRTKTCWFPVTIWISLATNSPFCTSRQAMYTRAPVNQHIRNCQLCFGVGIIALILLLNVIFSSLIFFTPTSKQRYMMSTVGKKNK